MRRISICFLFLFMLGCSSPSDWTDQILKGCAQTTDTLYFEQVKDGETNKAFCKEGLSSIDLNNL